MGGQDQSRTDTKTQPLGQQRKDRACWLPHFAVMHSHYRTEPRTVTSPGYPEALEWVAFLMLMYSLALFSQ